MMGLIVPGITRSCGTYPILARRDLSGRTVGGVDGAREPVVPLNCTLQPHSPEEFAASSRTLTVRASNRN